MHRLLESFQSKTKETQIKDAESQVAILAHTHVHKFI